uniref:Uncharacterized protein n=1 Tax=Anguilla anguilla TaxID=7936 RepID=A0A0E9XIY7_ANGAN
MYSMRSLKTHEDFNQSGNRKASPHTPSSSTSSFGTGLNRF